MSAGGSDVEAGSAAPRPEHPYSAEIEAERSGWYELAALVRSLTPGECLVPGYYVDPAWTVRDLAAWAQAHAGRMRMVQEWCALREQTDEAAWWVRKSGPDHYLEHVGRLREWVDELIGRRSAATGMEPPDPEGLVALVRPEASR